MTGNSDLFYGGKKTASCETLREWYKSIGKYVTAITGNGYKPGDLLFYQFDSDPMADHIGIAESYDAVKGIVTAIEGNTSAGNDSNGGEVMRRLRKISTILGAYPPDYGTSQVTPPPIATPTHSQPTLRQGSKGAEVKTLQTLLVNAGYKIDADGAFGVKTLSAVEDFQKSKGLAADGIVGKNTWASLDI